MQASGMGKQQWQDVNNLFCASFYNTYKDLPYDQVDGRIKNSSSQALIDFLYDFFDTNRLLALKDSYSLILAYKDEQLVGYTLYYRLEHQEIIHIQHLAVDTYYQGQGIGKLLLEATIQSNPEIEAVVLTTRILNKPAQNFYRKQGFYQITTIDNLVFDSRYSILLRKDIV